MKCRGCGNKEADRTRTRFVDGKFIDVCNMCADLSGIRLYDDVSQVHTPYYDEHLKTEITSRAQKADVMKRLNVREKSESTIPYIKDPEKRRKYCLDKFGDTK